jgi:hypothetical protein
MKMKVNELGHSIALILLCFWSPGQSGKKPRKLENTSRIGRRILDAEEADGDGDKKRRQSLPP